MKFCLFVISAFLLLGCMTEKNLSNHNDKFPSAAAKYASEKWPCPRVDSTRSFDSTDFLQNLEDLQNSVGLLNEVNDSLLNTLRLYSDTTYLVYDSTAPLLKYKDAETFLSGTPYKWNGSKWVAIDTSCRKFASVIEAQKNKIAKLEKKLVNPSLPIYITDKVYVADSALAFKYKAEKARAEKASAEISKWRNKATIRFWIIVALAAIIGGAFGVWFYKNKAKLGL